MQYPQALLLGGFLLCLVRVGAQAQSVTFALAQTTLATSLDGPIGVAVDGSGDVFFVGYRIVHDIVDVNGSIPVNATVKTVASDFLYPWAWR